MELYGADDPCHWGETAVIYSAFVPVLISVGILPVGCDSSDGSSAGISAEGECAVWCCARAAVPGQLCQGSLQKLEHSGQEQRCAGAECGSCQHWGSHSRTEWWLQCSSGALGAALECRWVSCAVLGAAGTQGSSLQWQGGGEGASSLPRLCHDLSSQACSSSCCKAATAALHQEASLKVLVLKLCGEEKKWDGI